MGLDLTIYPLFEGERTLTEKTGVCRFALFFERDTPLFGQMTQVPPGEVVQSIGGPISVPSAPSIETHDLPEDYCVNVFAPNGDITPIRRDVRGKSLRFAYARDLKRLQLRENAHPTNLAIKAFIDVLPDEIPVALNWH